MIRREHIPDLALGYRNRAGEYVCEKFENGRGSPESARATFPLDERSRSSRDG